MAKFRLSTLRDPDSFVAFDKERVTIGRSRSSDFVVKDPSVCRHQADITYLPEGFTLTNIGRFPVRVNKQPVDKCLLNDGDILSVGNEHFRFSSVVSEEFGHSETDDGYAYEQVPADGSLLEQDQADGSLLEQDQADGSPFGQGPTDGSSFEQRQADGSPFEQEPADITEWLSDSCAQPDTSDETLTVAPSFRPPPDQSEETVIDLVPAMLTISSGVEQGMTYYIDKPCFTIGRASDSDIVVTDRRISRKHFLIEKRESGYYLIKLSKHQAVLVNDDPVEECRLYNKDRIDLFTLSLTFNSTNQSDQRIHADSTELNYVAEEPVNEAPEEILDANATIIQTDVVAQNLGPRLVSHSKKGDHDGDSYPIRLGHTRIGRDSSCDIRLDGDECISRSHAFIEKREPGHYVLPKSKNPVLVNGRKIKRATRIYRGDTLQLGNSLLTFLSESKEDTPPVKKKTTGFIILLTSAATLAFAGFFLYTEFWIPQQIDQQIQSARQLLANANHESADKQLMALYETELTRNQRDTVSGLLAESVLSKANKAIVIANLQTAKDTLTVFLRRYGHEQEASGIWQKLNEVRYLSGKKYETEDNKRQAITEYLAVSSDSDYYSPAQKAISELWLKAQTKAPVPERQDRTAINGLLKKAGLLFSKKYYLTPINNNAYAIYAQVLALEPSNPEARGKIEEMKTFYRLQGSQHCDRGNKKVAQTYFRRFLIIEPDNTGIQALLSNLDSCSPSSGSGKTRKHELPVQTSEDTQSASTAISSDPDKLSTAKNKEKVRMLLREEGIESDWILKYLFDESRKETDSANTETPW